MNESQPGKSHAAWVVATVATAAALWFALLWLRERDGKSFEALSETRKRVEVVKRVPAQTMRMHNEGEIPLSEAIQRVNEQYPDPQPLTEEEVIAAVQAIKLQHPDIPEAIYEIYQRVASEKMLPKGMYFSRITGWNTRYGHFEVDWKDLTLDSLPGDNNGHGFNYRIRARFIAPRPTEADERR